MPGLIVSVRNVEEALIALEGGAALIDVKEPTEGSLGKADDAVIEAVLAAVAGQVPVSAAMGELYENGRPMPGLAFAKWGTHSMEGWWFRLDGISRRSPCGVVPAAYADGGGYPTPSPAEVCRFAVQHGFPALLIDTRHKDGRTLLDHLSLPDLSRIAARCREGGVKLALAGSLTLDAIRTLMPLTPDWFAVRGAACEGGREGRISLERVRELAALIRASGP